MWGSGPNRIDCRNPRSVHVSVRDLDLRRGALENRKPELPWQLVMDLRPRGHPPERVGIDSLGKHIIHGPVVIPGKRTQDTALTTNRRSWELLQQDYAGYCSSDLREGHEPARLRDVVPSRSA